MKDSLNRRSFLKLLLSSLLFSNGINDFKAAAEELRRKKGFIFLSCNLATGQIHSDSQNINFRALPGSLMKLIATMALSGENLISLNQTYECRGTVNLHGRVYNCRNAHGKVSLEEALAKSCNCFFAQASEKLSTHTFLKYAHKFFPDISMNSSEAHSQNYVLGLTDSIKLSPLQILQMVAQIAYKGQIHKFTFQSKIQKIPSTIQLSPKTWNIVQRGMYLACNIGTAQYLDPASKLNIAAKTGTAPHGNKFQSWVVGYFPYKKPKYAFCLWSPVGTSQDNAVPLARKRLTESNWE